MRKKDFIKRGLSVMLASMMTFSSVAPSYTTAFASEAVTEAEPVTEKVTEAPATEAPKAETNETTVPEAPAAEAPAPESNAPAAETPAPEATEAPAAETPAPEAPATEAQATEAPAAETPASEESKPEAGTESKPAESSSSEAATEAQTEVPAEREVKEDVPHINASNGWVEVSVENLDYSAFPEGVTVQVVPAGESEREAFKDAWMTTFENEYINAHKNLTADGWDYVRDHMKEHVYANGFTVSVKQGDKAYDKEVYVRAKMSDEKLSSGIAAGNQYHVGFHGNDLELQSDMKEYFNGKDGVLGLTFTNCNGWYSVVMRDKFSVPEEYFVEGESEETAPEGESQSEKSEEVQSEAPESEAVEAVEETEAPTEEPQTEENIFDEDIFGNDDIPEINLEDYPNLLNLEDGEYSIEYTDEEYMIFGGFDEHCTIEFPEGFGIGKEIAVKAIPEEGYVITDLSVFKFNKDALVAAESQEDFEITLDDEISSEFSSDEGKAVVVYFDMPECDVYIDVKTALENDDTVSLSETIQLNVGNDGRYPKYGGNDTKKSSVTMTPGDLWKYGYIWYNNPLIKPEYNGQGHCYTTVKPYKIITDAGTNVAGSVGLVAGYCMNAQGSLGTPVGTNNNTISLEKNGSKIHFKQGKNGDTTYDMTNVVKALYFLSNSPDESIYKSFSLFGKDVLVTVKENGKVVTKKINFKTLYESYGLTSAAQQYNLTHIILSYIYYQERGGYGNWTGWNGSAYGAGTAQNGMREDILTDKGKEFVKLVAKYVKGAQYPEAEVVAVDGTENDSFFCPPESLVNGYYHSKQFQWNSIVSNVLTFDTLPADVRVYNDSQGKFTNKVKGGEIFHFVLLASAWDNKSFKKKQCIATAEIYSSGATYLTKGGATDQDLGVVVTMNKDDFRFKGGAKPPEPEEVFPVVYLSKTSLYPDITNGNNNYTFNGATFVLNGYETSYMVCDASGISNTIPLTSHLFGPDDQAIQLTLTEIATPAGYKPIPPTTVTINPPRDINGNFPEEQEDVVPQLITINGLSSVVETPKVAPAMYILKTNRDGSEKPMDTAQFTFTHDGNGVTRSWTLRAIKEADGNYYARMDNAHLVAGDFYRDENGNPVLPLGTLTIDETNVPEGYSKPSTLPVTGTIVESGDTAVLSMPGLTVDGNGYNFLTETNVEKYGKIIIDKSSAYQAQDPDGDATFAGAEFSLTNVSGYGVTRNKTRDLVANGDVADVIVTDENGEGMSVYLQAGCTYHIEEKKAPEGYKKSVWSADITIPDVDECVVDLRNADKKTSIEGYQVINNPEPIVNTPVEGGFRLEKRDLELADDKCTLEYEGHPVFHTDAMFGENGAQGDATLDSAVFALYNISKSKVSVILPGTTERQSFMPNDKIFEFKTSGSVYVSDNDFLSYGTYRIVEVTPPEGYTGRGENLTMEFEIRDEGEIVKVGKNEEPLVAKNDVKRFDIKINKMAAELEDVSSQIGDENKQNELRKLIGVQFDITLKRTGYKYATITTMPEYDEKGNIVDVYATTADPAYPHGRLPYGEYIIHEVEGTFPEEYAPIDDIICDGRPFRDGYEKTYNFIDWPKEENIKIMKYDSERGTYIPLQAHFQILDENKNMVQSLGFDKDTKTWVTRDGIWDNNAETWVTDFYTGEDGCVRIPQLLPYGTYYLHEVEAPYGYLWNKDRKFEVIERPGRYTFIHWRFGDKPVKGKVQIKKLDSQTKELLDGAEFDIFAEEDIITGDGTLRYSKDDKVDHIVIGNKEHGIGESKELYIGIEGDAGIGKFYAVETKAPEGYALSDEVLHFELKYVDQDTPVVYDLEETENTPTIISLKKVEMKRDDSAKEWKPGTTVVDGSDDDRKSLAGITFKITRIGAPAMDRYNNDNVYTGGVHTTNDDGIIIETHVASGLYSIQEIKTRPGYVLDDTIRYFVVDKDGFVAECGSDGANLLTEKDSSLGLIWENKYTTWYFSKVDVNGDNEIEGAHMQILDAAGNVATYDDGNGGTAKAEWVSDGTTKYIPRLPIGGYTLVETQAPKGYAIAVRMPFEVTNDAIVHTVTMVDKKVTMTKTKVTGGEELPGAHIVVKDVKTDKVVDEWDSTDKPHEIENLYVGETYSLTETIAPSGYCIAETIQFTVRDDGKDQQVKMRDKILYMDKKDALGRNVVGAKFEVYEVLNGLDGIESLSEKPLDTWVTSEESYPVKNLAVGHRYRLVETEAPEGYVMTEPFDFFIRNDWMDQHVVVVDNQHFVTKVDSGIMALAGAELTVEEKDTGKIVDSWTSDGTKHPVTGLAPKKTYILKEVKAPEGYVIAAPVEFVVSDEAGNEYFDFINKQVFLSKTDITTGEEIEGAKITVYKYNEETQETGDVVDSWTSVAGEKHPISGLEVENHYLLREETAPDGYVRAEDIVFFVENDFTVQHIRMEDDYTKWDFTKTDVADGKFVEGAILTIRDADGNIYEEWVTGKEPHRVERIPVGTYTLTETQLPGTNGLGYVTAETITFEVTETGVVQTQEMKDEFTKVKITKTDITDSKPVIGAILTIKDEEGNVVEEWVTEEEPHYIERLPIGKYTLTETQLPGTNGMGYVTAETITFEVNDTPEIQLVHMIDDFTKVQITKSDITTSKPVIGATLTIRDSEGNIYDEWVTAEEPHYIERMPIGTYTLTETQLPGTNGMGYVTAETITFRVEDTPEIQKCDMKDDFTKLQITKSDITTSKPVIGATLTITDENGNVVAEWVTEETPHYIERLPIGKYVLTETQTPGVNGMGYVTAESMEFEIKDTPEIQKCDMVDDFTKLEITKSDITDSEPVIGAILEIIDSEGNQVDTWETTEEPYYIERLPMGKYQLSERIPADGYATAETIEFVIDDTPEIQKVEMFDERTQVEISKLDITDSKPVIGAKLVIKDSDGEEVESWVTEKEPHYIEMLPIGVYTLTEITAPQGYEVAETIKFEVEDTGEIQKVTMYDKPVTPGKPGTPNPQTGDDLNVRNIILIVLAIILLLGGGLFFALKGKKKDDKDSKDDEEPKTPDKEGADSEASEESSEPDGDESEQVTKE